MVIQGIYFLMCLPPFEYNPRCHETSVESFQTTSFILKSFLQIFYLRTPLVHNSKSIYGYQEEKIPGILTGLLLTLLKGHCNEILRDFPKSLTGLKMWTFLTQVRHRLLPRALTGKDAGQGQATRQAGWP